MGIKFELVKKWKTRDRLPSVFIFAPHLNIYFKAPGPLLGVGAPFEKTMHVVVFSFFTHKISHPAVSAFLCMYVH